MVYHLGSEIKRRRLKSRMTQKQLAERAKLSHTFISQIENGKYKTVSTLSLAAIANALNIKSGTLIRLSPLDLMKGGPDAA